MNRLRLFLLGWRRRSAMLMDNAGSPRWLTHWRCPVMRGWGNYLHEQNQVIGSIERLTLSTLLARRPASLDPPGISAADIRRRIAELEEEE